MKKTGILKYLDFVLLDFIIIAASFLIAGKTRLVFKYWPKEIFIFLIEIELFAYAYAYIFQNPYKVILKERYVKSIVKTMGFCFVQLLIVIALMYVFQESLEVSRLFIVVEYVLYTFMSIVCKYLWIIHLRKKAKKSAKKGNRKLLIVTTFEDSANICVNLSNANFDFMKILGLCVVDRDIEGRVLKGGYRVVCNYGDLVDYVMQNHVEEVYFSLDSKHVSKEIARNLEYAGVTVHTKINMSTVNPGRSQTINEFFGEFVITSSTKERKNIDIVIKRLVDIIGGLIGMLFVLIFTAIIGPIIKIKSPGPIFYKQERIGKNGSRFYIYKFRSMIPNADKLKSKLESQNIISSGLMFKVKDDPRIIPGIGNFIRKTSIDEFPQFLNVLKGDMSLVGTRPPTVDEWEKYEMKHRIRMTIKPGITGLWQVSGRNEITDFDEVVKLDTLYIDSWSLELDFTILVKTVLNIFNRKKSNEVM